MESSYVEKANIYLMGDHQDHEVTHTFLIMIYPTFERS